MYDGSCFKCGVVLEGKFCGSCGVVSFFCLFIIIFFVDIYIFFNIDLF